MVFLVLFPILLVLMLAGLFVAPLLVDPADDEAGASKMAIRFGTLLIGGLAAAVLIGCTSVHRVPAGHVAVVYGVGGDIVGQRGDGLNMTTPWQSIKRVSVQRQVYRPESQCSNGTERCIDTFSNDNQDVFVVATLNYHIETENVQTLMRDNPNFVDRSIAARFNQIVKDETVKYDATELAQGRELIRAAVRDRLIRELGPIGITVEDFLVDNIAFKPDFQAAIDDKVRAEQEAIAAQNRVAVAEANAQARAAEAQGEADRLRIEAQGQADANALLTASLTPALIQYQAIQKLADNISIMLVPSDGGLLIDPSRLVPQGQ